MIITDENILRQVSIQISLESGLESIWRSLNAELNTTSGVGLSAIQINLPLRACIIKYDKVYRELYNARIVKRSKETIVFKEGCLSIPDVFENTRRNRHITVRNGDNKLYKFSDTLAIIVQHELDHWEGILFTDRGVR